MRDYGKVFSQIWESEDFRSLSEDGRALVLYLLTCKHNTIAGVFRLPDGYACEDLQWTAERVCKGFAELSQKGFATRCEASKWVWVTKFLEWNPPENPNQRKSAAKIGAAVPANCGWKPAFMRVCGVLLGLEIDKKQEGSSNPSETVSQPGTETEAGTERNTPPPPRGDAVAFEPDGFKAFWAEWPRSIRKEAKGKCLEVWRRSRLEAHAAEILAHVKAMAGTEQWKREGGQFVPAPLVYLRGRRWEGADLAEETPEDRQLAGAI